MASEEALREREYFEPEESILPDIHTMSENVGPTEINVTSTNIKETTLSKYVEYTIVGEDSQGSFEVLRRYKDFLALRTVLVQNWPGCFVPQIPPKKIMGKYQAAFIEHRRKLLELFLKKSEVFLYHSEEFQEFLRGPPDFHKYVNKSRLPLGKIAQNYSEVFPEFLITIVSPDYHKTIQESLAYFQSTLATVEEFESICTQNVAYFSNFEKDLSALMQGFKDVTGFYAENYGNKVIDVPLRQEFQNPYAIVLDWAKAEILDLQAIIESIHVKIDFERNFKKLEEKLVNKQSGLVRIQEGKKSFIQKISGQKKEKEEQNIEALENDMYALTEICKAITARLVQYEIPRFKKQKSEKYELLMQTFTNMSIEEFQQLIRQTQAIEDCLA